MGSLHIGNKTLVHCSSSLCRDILWTQSYWGLKPIGTAPKKEVWRWCRSNSLLLSSYPHDSSRCYILWTHRLCSESTIGFSKDLAQKYTMPSRVGPILEFYTLNEDVIRSSVWRSHLIGPETTSVWVVCNTHHYVRRDVLSFLPCLSLPPLCVFVIRAATSFSTASYSLPRRHSRQSRITWPSSII